MVQKYTSESDKVFVTANDNEVKGTPTPDTQPNGNIGRFHQHFTETIEEVIGLQYFISVVIYSISKNKKGV